ncbi:MAG: ATP-binding protein [Syntrophales bacterium]|nr:ATP-binding protein [Syntrophales bacterium]
MQEIALHILDLAENSARAGAKNLRIKVEENTKRDIIQVEIEDDGRGMDENTLKEALDPFFTTKQERRFGLGLAMINQATEQTGGTLEIFSSPNVGTKLKFSFQKSHIDRQPMGDMAGVIMAIVAGNPEMDIEYEHICDDERFSFSTKEIRKILDDIPINRTEVLTFIRKCVYEGLRKIGAET